MGTDRVVPQPVYEGCEAVVICNPHCHPCAVLCTGWIDFVVFGNLTDEMGEDPAALDGKQKPALPCH